MSREWKPGDVGMSRYGRVFYTERGWRFDDASGRSEEVPADLRPLVVIDPEDREQVEQFASLLNESLDFRDGSLLADAVAAAFADTLRSLLTPPKPDEPTGLGAVVEDADGERWLRWEIVDRHPKPWCVAGAILPNRAYAEINAVRVLSEGVQP